MKLLSASTVFLALLFVYLFILLAFKKFCLKKIKNSAVQYTLGMALAYTILPIILIFSRESELVRESLQNASLIILMHDFQDASMLLIVVPTFYSIFLLGYFEKGGVDMEWKSKFTDDLSFYQCHSCILGVNIYQFPFGRT